MNQSSSRRAAAIVFALFAVVASAVAQSTEPKDLTAVVAAWNIMDGTGNDDRIDEIALGVAWLDAEVIVLTEASKKPRMDLLVRQLNEIGANYSAEVPQQTASDQIAILFKQGVAVSNVQLLAGSDDGNTFLRKAVTADVKIGEFDFVLIGVHMKASRSASDRAIRTRQARIIANFISSATSGIEKDVLIVGDYNMIPAGPTAPRDRENFDAMNPTGFLQFISSEDLAGQGSHIRNGRIGNLLDGYGISFDHTNEYIEGSLRIFPLNRTFRMSLEDYSEDVADHLPLVARFDITEDDDQ